MRVVNNETKPAELTYNQLKTGVVYKVHDCAGHYGSGWIGSYVVRTEKASPNIIFCLASNGPGVSVLQYVGAGNSTFVEVPKGTKLEFEV